MKANESDKKQQPIVQSRIIAEETWLKYKAISHRICITIQETAYIMILNSRQTSLANNETLEDAKKIPVLNKRECEAEAKLMSTRSQPFSLVNRA